MSSGAAFSVIIPSYQGANRVLKMLACLENQSYKNFEAIVVIDGSTDRSEQVLKNYVTDLSLKIIYQKNKGRAGARNTGARSASADFLVFLDDDIVFGSELLAQYAEYKNKNNSIVVGGSYAVPTSDHQEFFHYASYLGKKWTDSNGAKVGVLKIPYFNAQNCLIKKEVFWKLGGFDERLRDAEDYDLAIKAFERNLPIHFNNHILVGHHLQETFYGYAKRIVEYQKARKQLSIINPASLRYGTEKIKLSKLKRMIYTAFSSSSWIEIINRGTFEFLPQKVRFRVYDFLLTAYLSSNDNTTDG